jgi:ribosome biogenesis GTPase
MKGRVIKSTGSWYKVTLNNQNSVNARLKGNLRLMGSRSTNPIAVGDFVDLIPESEGNFLIEKIHERTNHIIRRSVNLSKKKQVIAANIDQAILICTIDEPKTLYGFMDRFLATAEAYDIPAIITFNKFDIYSKERLAELEYRESAYQVAGYRTLRTSAVSGEGISDLKNLLKDKVSLFSGHSGVGKSTLTNSLQPGLELKTSHISEANKQGKHTTTFAEMHSLGFGGYIIDTPGVRGFGLVDLEDVEISHLFPEIFKFQSECKFSDCKHLEEPGCAVRKAIQMNKIAPSRYNSYLSMLNGDEEEDTFRQDIYKKD